MGYATSTARNRIAAVVIALVGAAPLLALLGWGLYLRSDYCRSRAEQVLVDAFGLEAHIGWIEPIDFNRRRYHDVRIVLPDGQTIFRCDWALLTAPPEAPDRWEVLLSGPEFVIDEANNAQLLAIGQRDFTRYGVRQIDMIEAGFVLRQGPMRMTINRAEGMMTWIDEPDLAQIEVRARRINGHVADEPIVAAAVFRPLEAHQVEQLHLETPDLPLSALGLATLAGSDGADGLFRGAIDVDLRGGQINTTLRGRLRNAQLEQWTGMLVDGGVGGRADVTIHDAQLLDDRLHSLDGELQLDGLDLTAVGRALGRDDLTGRCDLTVGALSIRRGVIEQLTAAGTFEGVSLAPLAEAGNWGQVSGLIRGRLISLTMRDNRIEQAQVMIEGQDDPNVPRRISTALLTNVFTYTLGLELPEAANLGSLMLGYRELNAELLLNDDRLHVAGQRPAGLAQRRPICQLTLGPATAPIRGDFDRPLDLRNELTQLELLVEDTIRQIAP